MKHLIISVITLFSVYFNSFGQDLTPYIKVGESTSSIQEVSEQVIQTLKEHSFTVLGDYNPSNKSSLKVIAFTRNDLKNTVVKVVDRGALAAVMKIGLVKKGDKIIISYTNPDYLLRAYLPINYNTFKSTFVKFSADLKNALSDLGHEFSPFGGMVEADKLGKYHYKIMMPYFTDPVELREFSSFKEGLNTITNHLKGKKGNTKEVYRLIYEKEEVAVFGVGLQSSEDGESYFLPKIGEDHVAALPYEIILQGKKATILHGKYRIALHWPELTMGTFMKIMSTPGDIEDTLKGLCE
ncbi:MAG: hypothetical protein GW839_06475 [Flavobacteriales bacterium]|nr:hypothetical protein [Flavobacteriia bacterium]NCP04737.1 hypothetical protein [Flavobacteriales bacterium]PIV94495.1 MAG: hypothetical protein COW44_04005 [Flavobacteriaceae bacterium CG17_big_fil_post_rev_8_21_14_2_50_33_15]PIY10835.1 MAG: hypothetical protein COZ17_08680 [Flavobacteriaceae bacterium CG_4_10_14_3_um_filter_33_47]PJB17032.1 MAG: hypothetical protein CO117_13240 [Flavobacteriaceae bacterium CG_4_9_14_3_um_filter_33_16]